MINSEKVNDLSNNIKEMVKESPLGDLEHNLNALLKGVFTKMELVSREEFDVQTEVLRLTRQKLQVLEARLVVLEADLDATSHKPNA